MSGPVHWTYCWHKLQQESGELYKQLKAGSLMVRAAFLKIKQRILLLLMIDSALGIIKMSFKAFF